MNNEGLLYFIGWINLIQGKGTLRESGEGPGLLCLDQTEAQMA